MYANEMKKRRTDSSCFAKRLILHHLPKTIYSLFTLCRACSTTTSSVANRHHPFWLPSIQNSKNQRARIGVPQTQAHRRRRTRALDTKEAEDDAAFTLPSHCSDRLCSMGNLNRNHRTQLVEERRRKLHSDFCFCSWTGIGYCWGAKWLLFPHKYWDGPNSGWKIEKFNRKGVIWLIIQV